MSRKTTYDNNGCWRGGYAEPAKTAAPLLTDWIPCTTPPVREGEYELTANINIGTLYPVRVNHSGGRWLRMDGSPFFRDGDDELADWSWRGVRRWVLIAPSLAPFNPCDQVEQERSYVAHVSKRGVLYLTDKLHAFYGSRPFSEALSFATEVEANAYAAKHARVLKSWKAVLAC